MIDPEESDELSDAAVGMSLENASFGLVIAEPVRAIDPITNAPEPRDPQNSQSFTALRATAETIRPVGLPEGLELTVQDVDVQINAASQTTAGQVVADPPVIDFTASDFDDDGMADGSLAIATGGDDVEIDYDETLLAILGSLTIDAFGLVVGSGTFAMEKSQGDFAITNAEGEPTTEVLEGADYLSFGVTITDASIGGDDGPSLGSFQLAMLLVSDSRAGPITYSALRASLGAPDLGVLPDGLTITGSLALEINKSSDTANPNRVLDFVDTAGFDGDLGNAVAFEVAVGPNQVEAFTMDGNQGQLLRISGSLLIDVFGFVILEGDFGFENAVGNFVLTDPNNGSPVTTELNAADYLLITGAVQTAFAGINGENDLADNDDDGEVDEAGEVNNGASGFNLNGVEFTLVVVTDEGPTAAADDDIKYTSLKANVQNAGFLGIEGFEVGVEDLAVIVNRTNSTTAPNRVLDFADTDGDDGDDAADAFVPPVGDVVLDVDGNEGSLLAVAGNLNVTLFEFVNLSGFLSFKTATGDFKIADNTTNDRTDFTPLTTDYFLVTGAGVDAFAGSGGGTSDSTGVSLEQVSFSLAVVKDDATGIGYTALVAKPVAVASTACPELISVASSIFE